MKKIKIYLPIILSVIVLVIMISMASFAFFNYYKEGNEISNLSTGYLDIDLDESRTLTINNENVVPMYDSEGVNLTPYEFTLTNTGTGPIDYTITIINDQEKINSDGCSNNLLGHDFIRVQLVKDNVEENLDFLNIIENNLYSDTMYPGESSTFDLRLWIYSEAGTEIMGKHYHGKLSIKMSQHTEKSTN